MTLTPAQQATLNAYIESRPELEAYPHNGDGGYAIAAVLNQPAVPAYIVWKTAVSVDEIMRNGINWERVDNLSVGKARIWDWMGRLGSFDASKTNIRAGIDAVWVGTQADLDVRAAVYVHCKRGATVIEQLFATGTGTTGSPATMAVEGPIGYQEIEAARGSA
jgi:hypothetical protein